MPVKVEKGQKLSAEDQEKVPVFDDGSASELLVDGLKGVGFTNGVLRLNLTVDRFNAQSNALQRMVICRLALPLPVAEALRDGISAILKQMLDEGVIAAPKKEGADGAN
ncbi:MAG: hypothetical protein ACRD3S_16130 [Terracidiphilus sp.]